MRVPGDATQPIRASVFGDWERGWVAYYTPCCLTTPNAAISSLFLHFANRGSYTGGWASSRDTFDIIFRFLAHRASWNTVNSLANLPHLPQAPSSPPSPTHTSARRVLATSALTKANALSVLWLSERGTWVGRCSPAIFSRVSTSPDAQSLLPCGCFRV